MHATHTASQWSTLAGNDHDDQGRNVTAYGANTCQIFMMAFLLRQHCYYFTITIAVVVVIIILVLNVRVSCLHVDKCNTDKLKSKGCHKSYPLLDSQGPINRGHGAQYLYRPPPVGANNSQGQHCECQKNHVTDKMRVLKM
jgi:hypothetical protein